MAQAPRSHFPILYLQHVSGHLERLTSHAPSRIDLAHVAIRREGGADHNLNLESLWA